MKKKLLLSAAVASLTIAPALSLVTSCAKKENLSEVHIININDFHGAAPGYGDADFEQTNINNPGAIRLVNEWEAIKAKYPGSVVIAGGDLNAGEGFSTCKQGETFYPVLKQMDIRYSTVGNHAWEWGSEPLENYHYDHLARTKDTVGSYFFTSNVLNGSNYREKTWVSDPESYRFADDYNLWKQVRVPWADPFKMLNLNGHNVCLIGLTTKDTLTDGNMESMKTLSFMDYNAAVVYSKMYAYETLGEDEFNKIDAFILDTHLECQAADKDKPFEGVVGEAAVLAKDLTTSIDGILAAHSHMICSGIVHNDTLNKDIPIAQGGQAGRRYIDTALVFNDAKKAGKRLKSIKMEVVKPNIEGISDPDHPDIKAASKQIADIISSTTNERVKDTAHEYMTQKQVALTNLLNPIGKMSRQSITQGTVTKYGLPYWYTDDDKGFGTKFLQSPTLLEPAGIWANIAMVDAFNKHYDEYINTLGLAYPVSVAFTNLDSLKSGFTADSATGDPVDITKKNVFQMHAFENAIHYGCITVDQLRQYINYFLAGAGKFDYGNKTGYDKDFYYEADHSEKNKVVWDKTETVNVLDKTKTTLGTSYTSGVNQFYGISFSVKKGAESSTKGQYEYTLLEDDNHPLLIYDPNQPNADLYDTTTWVNAKNWTSNNGYIPIIIASFTWQGGNAQNRMLHHWFDYNGNKDSLAGHQIFDLYTRNSALEYIDELTKKGWLINQVGDSSYIDDAFVKKMLNIVE